MRIGVLGTLVHDRIWHPAGVASPLEQWGGLAYSLAGFSAARAEGWEIVPITKVGADLSDSARRFMAGLPGLDTSHAVREVPEATNRVELRYFAEGRRHETLSGGVPGWRADELAPLLDGLDALYINFISGFELDLPTARTLRSSFGGPVYADLHSLFLGPAGAGPRRPRPLPEAAQWLTCFDAVQLNADEARLLEATSDALDGALEGYLALKVTTLGANGAEYVGRRDLHEDPMLWPASRDARTGPLVRGRVAVPGGAAGGDPTGCGDVWGSVFFSSLLSGLRMADAVEAAHLLASQNARSRGIEDLRTGLSEALGSFQARL